MSPMRKQYHFYPGEQGRDAWDVDRLIALSRNFVVRDVLLVEFSEVDSNYWSFDATTTVRDLLEHVQLINEVDASYPIILRSNGCIMDGMHRVVRAVMKGDRTIRAVQFTTDPEPDFRNCRSEDLPY